MTTTYTIPYSTYTTICTTSAVHFNKTSVAYTNKLSTCPQTDKIPKTDV